MLIFFLILFSPFFAQAEALDTENLWQNDAIHIDFQALQQKLLEVRLTPEEGLKISVCFEPLLPELTASGGATPSAELQRAIANCYRGTQLESIVSPVYEQVATVIDCGKDTLGVARIEDATRIASNPTPRELSILKECYIERTAPVIASAAAINVFATSGARNVALLLYTSGAHIWFLIRGRRKNQCGVALNSLTKLPVDLAIIRISTATGAAVKTTVTDQRGNYYLFAEPGEYELSLSKPGFDFPSQFPPSLEDSLLVHNDSHVTVSHQSPSITYALPADPLIQEPTVKQEHRRRLARKTSSFVAALSPLAGIGTALASPKWWVIAFAALNIALYIVFRHFNLRLKPKTFGVVTDATGAAVADVIVRVFDTTYNKLVASTITDRAGRYGIMIGRGNYTVRFEKSAVGRAEIAFSLETESGVIAKNVSLVATNA